MSEESILTAKIFVAISLLVALLIFLFNKAQAKPVVHTEEMCLDTLDKPWLTGYEHGEAYGYKMYCGKIVVMRKGVLTIR